MKDMIYFRKNNYIFTLRSAAVILHENYLLVCKSEYEDFYFMPGGRVEFMESSGQALMREMQEELGEDVTVNTLLWVIENFFEHQGTGNHEIGFYYQAELPAASSMLDKKITHKCKEDDGTIVLFEWISLERLEEIPLYPVIIKEKIASLKQHIEHIIVTKKNAG